MKIGELARATGTPVATIRYYERAGLVSAAGRSDGNYRIYGTDHVALLSFIRQCRNLDMALDEIRVLLRFRDAPDEDCGVVNDLIDEHIGHVADRIAELRQLERQLERLRERCQQSQNAEHCGILTGLTESARSGMVQGDSQANTATQHVHGAHHGGPLSIAQTPPPKGSSR